MATIQIDQAIADQMVAEAVNYSATQYFTGDTQRTLQALKEGRCEVCGVLSDHLEKQVGEYLGHLDKTVKAVYSYGPERGSIHAQKEAQASRRSGINLVAWVDRKSAALCTLSATLETVLAESQRKIGCKNATPACYTLDVQLVDDEDVMERRGYGVIVDSMLMRTTQVWRRYDLPKPDISTSKSLQTAPDQDIDLELAPESSLLEYALSLEGLATSEHDELTTHLLKVKAGLIHRIISDQPAYINVAKKWFTISDLESIHRRKIGNGKIGGKAAGVMLAARIINEIANQEIKDCIHFPESYFLGSDLIYIFMAMNGLMHWNDQKYKPEDQICAEYPQIQEQFQAGRFPPEVLGELQLILDQTGAKPLIVRSSSQLEDNFGTSFAGKYDSYFCPNQGSSTENLKDLTLAISRTYASTLKPEALLYRRSKGLQTYDERMAILIQEVQGERFGRYFLPQGAGVAFSRNIYRWSPQIRREDGFVRLVWGLGTRAVGRFSNDYPRLIALSHPTLQPDDSTEAIRHYSQHYVDSIDLVANQFVSLPVHEVLDPRYPPLRYLVQLERDGFFVTPRTRVRLEDVSKLAITFEELLRRTNFPSLIADVLRLIERNYHATVDMEFTIHIPNPNELHPKAHISLLQCRPQSHLQDTYAIKKPADLKSVDLILTTHFMVPQGYLPGVRYTIFVDPQAYYALPTPEARAAIGLAISRLNNQLGEKSFICVGPGRWGTTNPDLGVSVSYADIYNAGALIELSGEGIGSSPEPSLGTHFFQDLMEAQIYPLVIRLEDQGSFLNTDFFYGSPNALKNYMEADEQLQGCLRLIEIDAFRPGYHLDLFMDDAQREATAYLSPDLPEGEQSR